MSPAETATFAAFLVSVAVTVLGFALSLVWEEAIRVGAFGMVATAVSFAACLVVLAAELVLP